MHNSKKVWFITGISRGLGKAIAQEALSRGDSVIGTSRDGSHEIDSGSGNLHVLPLDVNNREQVFVALEKAYEIYLRLDVLVNNAGYGQLGPIEHVSAMDARRQFETNFFGALNVIQAALPSMRAQHSGHIINVSSIAGFDATPGGGLYAASKFALEGLSESLAKEVKPLGLHVTIVEPGAFRTDFLSDKSLKISGLGEEYAHLNAVFERFSNMDGTQAGDPARAAEAIVDVTREEEPPLRLVLGPDALMRVNNKIASLNDELKRYESVSRNTDFAGVN
jgi:NAD(P)-dependent dehydrogenase (short-subunit alcohol dehydrogenase family)